MVSIVIQQGLIFSLTAVAVYLSSRVIRKDDLSIEGSFGIGGAITALLIEHKLSPSLAMMGSIFAGTLLGLLTGFLHTRLKMNHLMAGLVSTTAAFSLSLSLASANKVVEESHTIFSLVSDLYWWPTLVLLAISTTVIFIIRYILNSEVGLLLYCAGENPHLLVGLGKSSTFYNILCFMLANGITGLSGSLFVQWSGVFSITGNVGTLITGLACLMLSELLTKRLGFIIILSAILYQGIFVLTLELGVDPVFNNLIKAMAMVSLMMLAKSQKVKHA